jgi:hypothetical protein
MRKEWKLTKCSFAKENSTFFVLAARVEVLINLSRGDGPQ